MKYFFVITLIILNIFSTSLNAGTLIDNFIDQSFGARRAALGGCGVAGTDNLDNMLINPSSIAGFDSVQLKTSYSEMFESSVQRGSIGVVLPLSKITIGLAVPFARVNELYETKTSGQEFAQGDAIKDLKNAAVLGLAFKMSDFKFGFSGKLISQTLNDISATGLGYDFGAQYECGGYQSKVVFGLSLINIGGTIIDWDGGHQDEIPMKTVFGLSYQVNGSESKTLLMAELVSDEDTYIAYGAEFSLLGISFRAGNNTKNDLMSMTYGLGLDLGLLNVDYSMRMHEELGNISRFSLGVKI